MRKKRVSKGMVAAFIIACLALTGCSSGTSSDQLEYEGASYVPVTFNQDIFSCGLGVEGEFETDVSYPIGDAQFDMIHNNGDLYVAEEQAGEAAQYYQDDANYDWKISVMGEEKDIVTPIEITLEERDYIYEMEGQEKDLAIYFDEIEQQATLIKTSKDGIARGSIELALYDGQWYWRTEIIDDTREKDGTWPEYVYPLPKGFGGIELK